MEFVPFLVLTLLVKKTIDWLRVLLPDSFEAKVLIPASMVVGVGYAFLFSAGEDIASAVTIWGDNTLASASAALVVVYGLSLGAGAGVLHDAVKPNTPPHDGT